MVGERESVSLLLFENCTAKRGLMSVFPESRGDRVYGRGKNHGDVQEEKTRLLGRDHHYEDRSCPRNEKR